MPLSPRLHRFIVEGPADDRWLYLLLWPWIILTLAYVSFAGLQVILSLCVWPFRMFEPEVHQ